MGQHEVCTWLGLTSGTWPPDYYTLLGLAPGDSDVERIEQHVHERLTRLRSHQLHHPEQATEAMNLLARAFACLTDPAAKQAYDASLFGKPVEAPPVPPEALPSGPEPSPAPVDPLAWLFGPWSQGSRQETVSGTLSLTQQDWEAAPPPPRLPAPPKAPEVAPPESVDVNGLPPAPPPAPPVLVPPPFDPLVEAAHSTSARRGLGTKRALYYRIARTRQLIWAWEGAGKYLRQPARRLTRSNEAADLIRQLSAVRRLLRRFPPLLGEAGQAGFYVVTLARQPKHAIIQTFRMLLPSQRETLARDWRDGYQLLVAHRQFLREELRTLRKTTRWGRIVRAVTVTLHDHRRLVLLAATVLGFVGVAWLVALAVILWYTFAH